MSEPAAPTGRQLAALPYRWTAAGLEVALVTSRETGRWVIPKGWPMAGLTLWEAAAQEAREEAGLVGEIEQAPLGAFEYVKRRPTRGDILCQVDVFPLQVALEEDDWPERGQRQRRWFTAAQAAEAVDEPELKAMIRRFAGL